MTDKKGTGVTVVSYDSENRTKVNGYEAKGSYVRKVSYYVAGLTNIAQLAHLTDVSDHCEQFVKYECRNALFLYNENG